jgi:hypothetical protein
MPRFRKKPVEINAIVWEGGDYKGLQKFCGMNWGRADAHEVIWSGPDDKEHVVLWNTMEEQWLCCPKGHWIIRGVEGELYPCDPGVFTKTYDPA